MTSTRVLPRVATVAAILLGLSVLATVVAVAYGALTAPILPAADAPGPTPPASTAPPAPLTSDVSTAVPMHLRGPR